MSIQIATTVAPRPADSQLACARIGYVQANDAFALRQLATAAGFSVVGRDQYQHSDGSWVMMDRSGRVQRGTGTIAFSSIPPTAGSAPQPQPSAAPAVAAQPASRAISVNGSVDPTAAHGKLATAQIGFLPADTASLGQAATAAGFSQIAPDQYVHSDGSWIMLAGGRIERGVGTSQFTRVPQSTLSMPQGACPVSPGSANWNASWFRQNCALAQLGMIVGGNAGGMLRRSGFTQQGDRWTHPDGSWVRLGANGPQLGYWQYNLSDLPTWWR